MRKNQLEMGISLKAHQTRGVEKGAGMTERNSFQVDIKQSKSLSKANLYYCIYTLTNPFLVRFLILYINILDGE